MSHPSSIKTEYQDRIQDLETKFDEIKRKNLKYGFLRFVIFGLIAWWVYRSVQNGFTWIPVLILVGMIALFLIIIHHHTGIKNRQAILKNMIRINQNELDVIHRRPSFFDDGAGFHIEHSYTPDLDIFGFRSLYHMINRCFSEPGRKMLADWLANPDFDKGEILKRQVAIRTLMADIDLRQQFCAQGLVRFEKEDSFLERNEPLMNASTYRLIKIFSWIIPVIFLISVVLTINTGNNNMVLYGFLLNLVLTGLFYKTTAQVLQRAGQSLKNISYYTEPLKVLIQTTFQDDQLRSRQQNLTNIYHQLRILKKRYDLLESRANPMVGLLLNGLMGYDFMVMKMLQKWSLTHSSHITDWVKEIGWFEAIFSLTTFAGNNPTFTFPILDREMGITGSNIRHPFIPDEENIGNPLDFVLPMQVILLTGSNMSGKSTFLRSVGVNHALALAGCVVAADEFHTGLYGMLTSFRKSDSIQEQTSLFYDELKKLQFVFQTLDKEERTYLVLLDEILRGTNSDDKFFGSRQVLLRLLDQSAMTILATHDIALAQLEDSHGPVIRNFNFESEIVDGELMFDYKLRQGVAQTRNATFLMKKMGIIPATAE